MLRLLEFLLRLKSKPRVYFYIQKLVKDDSEIKYFIRHNKTNRCVDYNSYENGHPLRFASIPYIGQLFESHAYVPKNKLEEICIKLLHKGEK